MKYSNEKIEIKNITDILENKKNYKLLLEEIIYQFENKNYPQYKHNKNIDCIYVLEDKDNENIYRSVLKEHTYNRLKSQIKEESNLELKELPVIPVKLIFNGKNFNIFNSKLEYLLPNINITTLADKDEDKLKELYSNYEKVCIINTDFDSLKLYFD